MRTKTPHTYTRPSCKHPAWTKRKSDEDPHQGGRPDTTTTAQARFQLSPRKAHRSSDHHAGQVVRARCRGSRCRADTHPAAHSESHRVLLHVHTTGKPGEGQAAVLVSMAARLRPKGKVRLAAALFQAESRLRSIYIFGY